jgi:hypothetical protein
MPFAPRAGQPPVGSNSLVTGITLRLVQLGNQFSITETPQMPTIEVEASLVGAPAAVSAVTRFEWTVSLTFDASRCPHGPRRTIIHSPITGTTTGNRFRVPFTQIRGGRLVIEATATVGGSQFRATLDTVNGQPITIVGTNPTAASITAAVQRAILRQMIRHESAQRQFVGACPLFSGDNLGGVGLFQITNPAPTDDEVWNWRANIAAGIRVFNQKLQTARGYPAAVRGSAGFQQLVRDFNAARAAQRLPSINVILPDFTDQEAELDACRGFNGWAGRDQFGNHLHEFRVPIDAQGRLVVGGQNGTIVWERVPARDRPQGTGDPDYVSHVLARPAN